MRLSPGKFNSFLNKMSQSVAWQKSHDCPCKDSNSGAAKYDCGACNAVGHLWDEVVTDLVALSGQRTQRAWESFGAYETGDVVVTIPSSSEVYDIGEFDRVVMSDSSLPFSITKLHDSTEKVQFKNVTVSRVFWLDDSDNVVEGGLPDVGEDGTPTWASGEPPTGKQYTITGRRSPEYFMYQDFPQDRAHHGGMNLPRKVVLRSFELMNKSL